MSLVLDASIVLAWHITRNHPDETVLAQQAIDCVISQGAIVPTLWFVEVANALVTAERRQISSLQASTLFLADLDSFPIATDRELASWLRSKIMDLSRAYQLTAYDATYLELALRTSSTLATFDRKLAAAARSAGIPVFGDKP